MINLIKDTYCFNKANLMFQRAPTDSLTLKITKVALFVLTTLILSPIIALELAYRGISQITHPTPILPLPQREQDPDATDLDHAGPDPLKIQPSSRSSNEANEVILDLGAPPARSSSIRSIIPRETVAREVMAFCHRRPSALKTITMIQEEPIAYETLLTPKTIPGRRTLEAFIESQFGLYPNDPRIQNFMKAYTKVATRTHEHPLPPYVYDNVETAFSMILDTLMHNPSLTATSKQSLFNHLLTLQYGLPAHYRLELLAVLVELNQVPPTFFLHVLADQVRQEILSDILTDRYALTNGRIIASDLLKEKGFGTSLKASADPTTSLPSRIPLESLKSAFYAKLANGKIFLEMKKILTSLSERAQRSLEPCLTRQAELLGLTVEAPSGSEQSLVLGLIEANVLGFLPEEEHSPSILFS